jgi:nicotinamide-nucleotide amidase
MTDAITELARQVGAALVAQRATLATAESCTGGGIAEAVTRIAGSSAWFGWGWVTYANAAKQEALGVAAADLQQHGAVSEVVVRQMASGAKQRAGSDWAVAVSGIAGPDGGSPDKPVGTVWLAWAGPGGVTTECCLFPGDRAAVRAATVEKALSGLLTQIVLAGTKSPVQEYCT